MPMEEEEEEEEEEDILNSPICLPLATLRPK